MRYIIATLLGTSSIVCLSVAGVTMHDWQGWALCVCLILDYSLGYILGNKEGR